MGFATRSTVPSTTRAVSMGAWGGELSAETLMVDPSAIIPWRYVRLRFSVESAANANVMLCAGIELSHRG